jgi:hypothetical protein
VPTPPRQAHRLLHHADRLLPQGVPAGDPHSSGGSS